MFILKEMIRKYFGIEMKVESKYAINRSPYLDRDFVVELNRTPFSSAYQKFMTSNPLHRFKGQALYGYINSINNPKLARINTNRGYSPYDVHNKFNYWKIFLPYFMKYVKKAENNFNADKTDELFISRHLHNAKFHNEVMDINRLREMYANNSWRNDRIHFNNALSWIIWYSVSLGQQ